MLSLYQFLTILLYPVLRILPNLRASRGKEIESRIPERRGISNKKRPEGKLVWIHAASNGEALSALPLIHKLQELPSAPTILITTMTVTAAKLMENRIPDGCIHQFIPYDYRPWVQSFHRHWQPDAVFWIESELWPNHLSYLQKNNIPAALINARMSEKSVKRWASFKVFFSTLLHCFSVILAQTERDKNNLETLGVQHVYTRGNLKDVALPLPYDPIAFDDMRLATSGRDIVLYASTHEGEEDIAASVHEKLKGDCPKLLSIIIPRHPKRGEAISLSLISNGHNVALRSLKMSPRNDTDIYVADTLGELGLFYRLANIVFVGNSLYVKPGGGHNLSEPALLNCAIISGDDLHNFSDLASTMPQANACLLVKNEEELEKTVRKLLSDQDAVAELSDNALRYAAEKQANGLNKIMDSLETVLKNANLM